MWIDVCWNEFNQLSGYSAIELAQNLNISSPKMSKEIYHEGWLTKSPPKKSIWLPKVSHICNIFTSLFLFLCIQIYLLLYLYLISIEILVLGRLCFFSCFESFVCDNCGNAGTEQLKFISTNVRWIFCMFSCQPIINCVCVCMRIFFSLACMYDMQYYMRTTWLCAVQYSYMCVMAIELYLYIGYCTVIDTNRYNNNNIYYVGR